MANLAHKIVARGPLKAAMPKDYKIHRQSPPTHSSHWCRWTISESAAIENCQKFHFNSSRLGPFKRELKLQLTPKKILVPLLVQDLRVKISSQNKVHGKFMRAKESVQKISGSSGAPSAQMFAGDEYRDSLLNEILPIKFEDYADLWDIAPMDQGTKIICAHGDPLQVDIDRFTYAAIEDAVLKHAIAIVDPKDPRSYYRPVENMFLRDMEQSVSIIYWPFYEFTSTFGLREKTTYVEAITGKVLGDAVLSPIKCGVFIGGFGVVLRTFLTWDLAFLDSAAIMLSLGLMPYISLSLRSNKGISADFAGLDGQLKSQVLKTWKAFKVPFQTWRKYGFASGRDAVTAWEEIIALTRTLPKVAAGAVYTAAFAKNEPEIVRKPTALSEVGIPLSFTRNQYSSANMHNDLIRRYIRPNVVATTKLIKADIKHVPETPPVEAQSETAPVPIISAEELAEQTSYEKRRKEAARILEAEDKKRHDSVVAAARIRNARDQKRRDQERAATLRAQMERQRLERLQQQRHQSERLKSAYAQSWQAAPIFGRNASATAKDAPRRHPDKFDYYSFLGLADKAYEATDQEISAEYRRLAMEYHPDMHRDENDKEKATKNFQKLVQVYEVLGDSERRKKYDAL